MSVALIFLTCLAITLLMGRRLFPLPVLALASLALAAPAAAQEPEQPAEAQPDQVLAPVPRIVAPLPTAGLAPPSLVVPQTVQLSDERTLSRWAYSERRAKIHSDHSPFARSAGRLRMRTEDGFPEVYLLLSEYVDSKRRIWVKVRIPKRPNGRIGWVRRSALGPYRINRQLLVINRRTLTAKLTDSGRTIWSSRVGVGKSGTRTPAGRFYVREKFRFNNAPVYGTAAIGTSAYAPSLSDWPGGGVIGIHGTNQPGLLPGRVSHGCVRVRNRAMLKLYRRIRLGTPIWVR